MNIKKIINLLNLEDILQNILDDNDDMPRDIIVLNKNINENIVQYYKRLYLDECKKSRLLNENFLYSEFVEKTNYICSDKYILVGISFEKYDNTKHMIWWNYIDKEILLGETLDEFKDKISLEDSYNIKKIFN